MHMYVTYEGSMINQWSISNVHVFKFWSFYDHACGQGDSADKDDDAK